MEDLGIYGAWLTVNRFCNFRCAWCYAMGSQFKSEDNMPLEMAKELIDLMHAIGIKNAILIGGETLFWPHLFEIATYLKSLGMESSVVTNGWLLGFEKFRKRVERSDITNLSISLKAGDREQYIKLTGFDGFDRVMDGLREVSTWNHIAVETSTVLSTAVLADFERIVEAAFANGASAMNLSLCGPMINDGKFDSSYMPEPREIVAALVDKYQVINEVSGGRFSIEESLPACLWPADFLQLLESRGQVSFGCHFKTRSGLLLDRWGRVITCNHLFDYPIGQYGVDFSDLGTFADFWKGAQLSAIYDKMLEYPANACMSCGGFDKCGGGCPLNWFVRDPETVIPKGGLYGQAAQTCK